MSHKSGDLMFTTMSSFLIILCLCRLLLVKLQVPDASQVVFLVTEFLAAMPNNNMDNNRFDEVELWRGSKLCRRNIDDDTHTQVNVEALRSENVNIKIYCKENNICCCLPPTSVNTAGYIIG